MNPSAHSIKNLMYMLPRIRQVKKRVAGADLGMGRFHVYFDRDEDITEIINMKIFHLDH